jgi:hypothetical protein
MRPNKDEYTGVVTIQYTERKTSLRDEGDGRRGGQGLAHPPLASLKERGG